MRRAARTVLLAVSLAAAFGSVFALATNPLALPLARLGAEQARASLERAIARRVDEGWLLPRLETAVAEGDATRAALLLDLADTHGVALPAGPAERADALVAPGWVAAAGRCGACALDVAECESVSRIVACALPIELTPLGDLNALRRQGANWAAGTQVDRIETGLALAGLAATGGVFVTAGASAGVKAGASVTRVARRSGHLTPGFSRALSEAADIDVAWARLDDYVFGDAPLDAVADTARLARLRDIGRDAGRLYRNTSATDAFALLAHVDDPGDLARLARLSDTAGDATRPAVETLGPARALRATTRLTDLVIAALGLLAALVVQAAGLGASAALGALRRRLAQH